MYLNWYLGIIINYTEKSEDIIQIELVYSLSCLSFPRLIFVAIFIFCLVIFPCQNCSMLPGDCSVNQPIA